MCNIKRSTSYFYVVLSFVGLSPKFLSLWNWAYRLWLRGYSDTCFWYFNHFSLKFHRSWIRLNYFRYCNALFSMGNFLYTQNHTDFSQCEIPQFHLLFIPKIDVYLTGRCLAYVLSGCKSRVDDDASGFNRSMVRMFVNGVASDMLLRPPLPPPFPLSAPIRAKSIFELTYGNSFGMGKFILNYYLFVFLTFSWVLKHMLLWKIVATYGTHGGYHDFGFGSRSP